MVSLRASDDDDVNDVKSVVAGDDDVDDVNGDDVRDVISSDVETVQYWDESSCNDNELGLGLLQRAA